MTAMITRVEIAKWDKDTIVPLSPDIVSQLSLTEGMTVDVEACDDGSILVRKVPPASRQKTLPTG
jgi:hypothetical protein